MADNNVIADSRSNIPRVIKTEPTNQADLVPLDVTIEVEFTDDIEARTVTNPSNFHLYDDNTSIGGEINYLPHERRATFKPSEKLKPNKQYRVVLDNDIKTISGYNLRSYSFVFTTVDVEFKLNQPEIVHPAETETVNETFIRWSDIKDAQQYTLVVAGRPDFNDVVYSTATSKTEVRPNLDPEREYFARVRAEKIYSDEERTREVAFRYQDLKYLGSNWFEAAVKPEHTPVYEIVPYSTRPQEIGAKVFKLDCYESNESVGEIMMYDRGESSAGDIFIKDPREGIIRIHYPLEQDEIVEFSFTHPVVIDHSHWSNTVSFYYDKTAIDFEEMLDQQGESRKVIELSRRYQVDPDINGIYFKVYYPDLSESDISIDIEGEYVNNLSDLSYGEAHGVQKSEVETEVELKYADWSLMADDRYEHKLDSKYTPILEFHDLKLQDYDISEVVEIVDKHEGVIAYKNDLLKDIVDIVQNEIDSAFADNPLVKDYDGWASYDADTNKYYLPVWLEGEDKNDLPAEILGVDVRYIKPDQEDYNHEDTNESDPPESFYTTDYDGIDKIPFDVTLKIGFEYSLLEVVETTDDYTLFKLTL